MPKDSASNIIAIPSENVLRQRLAGVIAEKNRLQALIRLAKKLDQIHDNMNKTIQQIENQSNEKETNQ